MGRACGAVRRGLGSFVPGTCDEAWTGEGLEDAAERCGDREVRSCESEQGV